MMKTDWDRYRIRCAELRKPVLKRFEKALLDGADLSTVQSAPVYTGQLTAALMTILRQMTDQLRQSGRSGGPDGISDADWSRVRRGIRKRYFMRLSDIDGLKIAEEYVRTHYQYQPPRTEEMPAWMLSWQGRHSAAADLVRRIEEETDAFVLGEIPEILRTVPDRGEGSGKDHYGNV